jgi:RNA polymerase sigma-70 factor (ECF subfamily)
MFPRRLTTRRDSSAAATAASTARANGRRSAVALDVGEEATATSSVAGSTAQPIQLDFDQVYEEHFEFVWRSLRLLGVAPELLEDVTQDVFSVVARQLDDFEGRASVRTWLFAILQRVAANQRRVQVRKLAPLEPLGDALVADAPSPYSQAEAARAVRIVEAHCASLAPEQCAVFVLALVEGVPAPEIARELGIPLNTVYSRIRNLRAGLRRILAGEDVVT